MNPISSSPYWPSQELPVLEAPDGAEAITSGGEACGNNNQVPPHAPPPTIHPGQMRPISAADGYAVSSDFVGNASNGTMMASGSMNGMNNTMNMMMMMPDAAGHHHYDQHHREAQWPGMGGGLAAAVHHMSLTSSSPRHSPPMSSSNQQMPHHPYEYSNNPNGIPVGQVVPSPYHGSGYDHPNHHHEYSGAYYPDNGHPHDGQHYYHNEEDSSPNSSNSRGSHHGGGHPRQKKEKPSPRDPALRAAYWRLKLSLLATSDRQHPQDRTNNGNPFAARDMVNPTKAEAWLAAIGAAESMAQKKDAKTNNGRMGRNKKNQHRRGRDQDPRGSRRGTREDTATNDPNGGIDHNKLLAAGYLKHLFHQLRDDEAYWDGPPRFHPTIPNWDEEGINQAALMVENLPGNRTSMGSGGHYYHDYEDPYMTPNNCRRGYGSGGGNGSNRYSVFGDDDEDSSDEEENTYGMADYDGNVTGDVKSTTHSGGSDTSSTGDLSEEEIVYHGEHAKSKSKAKAEAEANLDPADATQMATRRIVVRVLAALGDIHGVIGIDHSRAKPAPRWVRGASQYAFAFRSLTIGQELIDGQFAQMLQAEEEEDGAVGGDGKGNDPSPPTPRTKDRLDRLKAALAIDSEIIAVSLTSFARNRERYLNAAKSRIEFLQGRLLEDKESREQAFQGMGQDKWENNPTPRCTYSERRKKMEQELRQAKEGSERVSKLETPAKKKAPMGKKYTEPKSVGGKAKVHEGVTVEV